MKKSLALIAFLFILCGCTQEHYPGLKTLASGLEQPWPGSGSQSMTMMVRESGGHMVLHCRLQHTTVLFSKARRTLSPSRPPSLASLNRESRSCQLIELVSHWKRIVCGSLILACIIARQSYQTSSANR